MKRIISKCMMIVIFAFSCFIFVSCDDNISQPQVYTNVKYSTYKDEFEYEEDLLHDGTPYRIIMTKYLKNNTFVILPESINGRRYWITSNVFSECTAMESIFIPKRVELINTAAFSKCDKLKRVYYEGESWYQNSVMLFKNTDYKDNFTSVDYVYYYSETEPTSFGYYWHYGVNNIIVEW